MEAGAVIARLHHPSPSSSSNFIQSPWRRAATALLPPPILFNHHTGTGRRRHLLSLFYSQSLQLDKHSLLVSSNNFSLRVASPVSSEPSTLADMDWDNLGFDFLPTDYMYVMKCAQGEFFCKGELQRFGNIELNPFAGILNYGQGLLEGLKAYKTEDDNILLFRPEENAMRLSLGAERMCMPLPSVEQFVKAVKDTVLANERWVPPPGKGSYT